MTSLLRAVREVDCAAEEEWRSGMERCSLAGLLRGWADEGDWDDEAGGGFAGAAEGSAKDKRSKRPGVSGP